MRNKMLQLFLLLGLTMGITGFAQAQTGLLFRADIPFDFSVNGETLKAGEYWISFGFIRNSPTSFLIRSKDGQGIAVVNNTLSREVLKPTRDARIVFDKEGDNYTLAEIKSFDINVELFTLKRKQKSAKVTGVEVSMVRR